MASRNLTQQYLAIRSRRPGFPPLGDSGSLSGPSRLSIPNANQDIEMVPTRRSNPTLDIDKPRWMIVHEKLQATLQEIAGKSVLCLL